MCAWPWRAKGQNRLEARPDIACRRRGAEQTGLRNKETRGGGRCDSAAPGLRSVNSVATPAGGAVFVDALSTAHVRA